MRIIKPNQAWELMMKELEDKWLTPPSIFDSAKKILRNNNFDESLNQLLVGDVYRKILDKYKNEDNSTK